MHTSRFSRFLTVTCATLASLFAISVASAQTTITITAAADNSGNESDYADIGYVFGQSYTFTFTIAPGFAVNSNGETAYSSSASTYRSESAAEGDFFSSIGGTGVTGTYATPTDTDRFLDLGVYSNGNIPFMYINAKSVSNSLGLSTPNGSYTINELQFQVNDPRVSFDYPGRGDPDNVSYIDPATYFASYSTFGGSITGAEASSYFQTNFSIYPRLVVNYGNDGYGVTLSPTMIQISAVAVPEPSTYAVLAGLAALGFAAYRRRAQTSA